MAKYVLEREPLKGSLSDMQHIVLQELIADALKRANRGQPRVVVASTDNAIPLEVVTKHIGGRWHVRCLRIIDSHNRSKDETIDVIPIEPEP